MFNKDKLTIVLTPEHISMALSDAGTVVQAERVDLDPERWDDSWCGGLQQFDQPLRQLLARFGGGGKRWEAELFYSSPGSICRVDLTDQDGASSEFNMINGLRQTVGRANPADAVCLDSSDQGSLVLGIADTEQNLQKIFAWLNRSKVQASRIIPSSTSVVKQAVECARGAPEGAVVLYLSGRSSVICYSQNGGLKLVRLIELGLNSLADVYKRAMVPDTEQGNDSDLDAVVSADSVCGCDRGPFEMLFEHGIPIGQQITDDRFKQIMPSLAPVLQRISIEIKQTLRFAGAIETQPANLVICGPGASIPQIGVALGQSLDLHVEVDPKSGEDQQMALFGKGTDGWAAACDFDLEIEILPSAAWELRTRGKLWSALKAGAVASAVYLGGQFFVANQQSKDASDQLSKQASMIERIESDRDRRQAIRGMADSLGTAASLIEDTMGQQADWVGLLGSMPDQDREFVQIHEIQGQVNSSHPVLNLTGTALAHTDGADASQVLSAYIKTLKQNDQVKRIEIGSTSRSMLDDSIWGLNFVLSIEMTTDSGQFTELIKLSMGAGG